MLVLDVWLIHVSIAIHVRIFIFSKLLILEIILGKKNAEQHCPDMSGTYNSTELDKVTPTYGGKHDSMKIIIISFIFIVGYSNFITVKEHFVCKIPKTLPLDAAAPLLCAGITTYSPLKQHNVGKDTRMGYLFRTNSN